MKCMRCGHNLYQSTTAEAVETETGVLVIRNIPCYKCNVCDEIHLTGDVVKHLESIIAGATKQPQDVAIFDYGRAA